MSNPKYDWPVLRELFPGKYETEMPSNIDPNGWFHVKLSVSPDSVNVYINNNIEPLLKSKLLGQRSGNMLGYWVGDGSGGEWKNLTIKK